MKLGANAGYICLPEDGSFDLKPSNLTYEEAITIPFGGNTGLHFLWKVIGWVATKLKEKLAILNEIIEAGKLKIVLGGLEHLNKFLWLTVMLAKAQKRKLVITVQG